MKLMKLLLFCLLALYCFSFSTVGQNLANKINLINGFKERTWDGHYSNPEDSHYVHKLAFKTILNDNVIILSKEVEELNFEMKIFFYWNPEVRQILFQSITNKGQLSRGVVSLDKDRIILIGENIEKTKRSKFKQSFELVDGNIIVDRFYLMDNSEWKQRHYIKYE